MEKLSHTAKILRRLLQGETLISSDVLASNSNQYFKKIKEQGIQLIEWIDKLEGKHKKRKLNFTDENLERAKKYLKKLLKSESTWNN